MKSALVNAGPIGQSPANLRVVAPHSGILQPAARKPSIRSISDQYSASLRERDLEVEQLLLMRQGQLRTSTSGSSEPVLNLGSQRPMSAEQAVAAGFRLVSAGKPGHGVILHYGQLHFVEIPGLVGSGAAPYRMGAALKSRIRQCQRKIFDEFLASGIRHVFVEGLEQTLVPDEFIAGTPNANARDKIRARFHGYRPGDTLAPDVEHLFCAGGDQIYGHLVAGVTLHATTTPAQVARQLAYYNDDTSRARFVANKFSVPQQDRAIFFDDVEQILMGKVKQVMQGKTLNVVLAFGRDHAIENLAAFCKGADFSPAIYSKDATS